MVYYTLPFINKGKKFKMPNWTPRKHEAALAEMIEETEKYKIYDADKKVTNADEVGRKQADLFKYYVILQSLREIDESVTFKIVREIHIDSIIQLFNAVYAAGKLNIIYEEKDFQKTPVEEK